MASGVAQKIIDQQEWIEETYLMLYNLLWGICSASGRGGAQC